MTHIARDPQTATNPTGYDPWTRTTLLQLAARLYPDAVHASSGAPNHAEIIRRAAADTATPPRSVGNWVHGMRSGLTGSGHDVDVPPPVIKLLACLAVDRGLADRADPLVVAAIGAAGAGRLDASP